MKTKVLIVKFICLLPILLALKITAQSTSGLSGIPDTSYSNYNAYISTKKMHPEIRMVEEVHSSSITEIKNIIYCNLANRKLLLDVFAPAKKSKQKRAAVIIIHGGGWRTGNKTQHHAMA
ncbi:MAG: hypothetical protein V4676_08635, partial [Bacteroidota bacterium]